MTPNPPALIDPPTPQPPEGGGGEGGRPSSPALLPWEKGDTPCPRGGRVGEGGEYRKGDPD